MRRIAQPMRLTVPMNDMTLPRDDAAWIRELGATDHRQGDALVDLQKILLRGLARSFGGNGNGNVDDGFLEDVVQDAMVKLLANLDSFEGRSRFTTWAMAIAVRVALSDLRKKRWRDVSLERITEGSVSESGLTVELDGGPDQQAEERAIVEMLHRRIDRELTSKQQLAIHAELAGMSKEEIARRLGSNVNAVYKLLHDARKRLKHGLESAGFSSKDVASAYAQGN